MNLKEIIDKGYEPIGMSYATYQIYKRDNDRLLYNAEEDKVILFYKMEVKNDGRT